jgi:hypothetical protein
MPDEITGRACHRSLLQWDLSAGPICRAAPTRLAGSGRARSRRWLLIGGIVVAGLLGGASAALAVTGASPPAVHVGQAAVHDSSSAHPRSSAG